MGKELAAGQPKEDSMEHEENLTAVQEGNGNTEGRISPEREKANTGRPGKGGASAWLPALIIGLSVVLSCIALAFGLANFRAGGEHSIGATGSASVDFESDLVTWGGSFLAHADTAKTAYRIIKEDAELVREYLLENGIDEEEIVFDSVDITQRTKDT